MSRARYECPVCGQRGFRDEPTGGTYDICGFCMWEDDTADPDVESGANGMSMRAYRQAEVAPAQAAGWIATVLRRRFSIFGDGSVTSPSDFFDGTLRMLDEQGVALNGRDVIELEQYADVLGAFPDALVRLRSRAVWT